MPLKKEVSRTEKVLLVLGGLAALVVLGLWVHRAASDPRYPLIEWADNGSQSYVWIEELRFNDGEWYGGGGFVKSGYGPPPVGGGGAQMNPKIAPVKLEARWFNFSQQRCYEALLLDPDLPEKSKAIVKRQPAHSYSLKLMTIIGDAGDVQLWLYGTNAGNAKSIHRFMEFLSSAQGHEVACDLERYRKATEGARRRGEIPLHPVPPPHKE